MFNLKRPLFLPLLLAAAAGLACGGSVPKPDDEEECYDGMIGTYGFDASMYTFTDTDPSGMHCKLEDAMFTIQIAGEIDGDIYGTFAVTGTETFYDALGNADGSIPIQDRRVTADLIYFFGRHTVGDTYVLGFNYGQDACFGDWDGWAELEIIDGGTGGLVVNHSQSSSSVWDPTWGGVDDYNGCGNFDYTITGGNPYMKISDSQSAAASLASLSVCPGEIIMETCPEPVDTAGDTGGDTGGADTSPEGLIENLEPFPADWDHRLDVTREVAEELAQKWVALDELDGQAFRTAGASHLNWYFAPTGGPGTPLRIATKVSPELLVLPLPFLKIGGGPVPTFQEALPKIKHDFVQPRLRALGEPANAQRRQALTILANEFLGNPSANVPETEWKVLQVLNGIELSETPPGGGGQ